MVSLGACSGVSAASRCAISSAARRVKVIARQCCGATPCAVTRCAKRCLSVRVLPVPGPAMISNGPSVISAAAPCPGSSPSSNDPVVVSGLAGHLTAAQPGNGLRKQRRVDLDVVEWHVLKDHQLRAQRGSELVDL